MLFAIQRFARTNCETRLKIKRHVQKKFGGYRIFVRLHICTISIGGINMCNFEPNFREYAQCVFGIFCSRQNFSRSQQKMDGQCNSELCRQSHAEQLQIKEGVDNLQY
jgi:hypothetical protein